MSNQDKRNLKSIDSIWSQLIQSTVTTGAKYCCKNVLNLQIDIYSSVKLKSQQKWTKDQECEYLPIIISGFKDDAMIQRYVTKRLNWTAIARFKHKIHIITKPSINDICNFNLSRISDHSHYCCLSIVLGLNKLLTFINIIIKVHSGQKTILSAFR